MAVSARTTSLSVGRTDASREILIFHGYTGSPDEFRSLAEKLAARFDAHVSVPLLHGHGTAEMDLLPYRFDDFLTQACESAGAIAASGKEFVIMGHSFGGYLAILMAAEFRPVALVLTVVPYSLRWPLWAPGIARLMRMKTLWDKKISDEEKHERAGLFFYRNMPGIGLTLVHEGIRRARRVLHEISCPILTIHTEHDPLTPVRSGSEMLAASGGNAKNAHLVIRNREHGIFYGKGKDETIEDIARFLATVFDKA